MNVYCFAQSAPGLVVCTFDRDTMWKDSVLSKTLTSSYKCSTGSPHSSLSAHSLLVHVAKKENFVW